MDLTKKEQAEVSEVYDTWLHSYLTGDVKTYDSYFDEQYHFIGSTDNEDFLNRKDTTGFFKKTADQLAGKVEIRNNIRTIEKFNELIFVTERFDAYFLIESEWSYYGKFRFTSALQKKKEGWRFIYQHFSTPDSKAQEGETIGTEQIAAENLMLREAVKRRTTELEQKNRELEIETALEKVRSRTMGMQSSNELPEVANLLFLEIQALGIPAWSAGYCIWNEEKSAATAFMSSEGVIQKPFSLPAVGVGYNFQDPLQSGEPFHVSELGGEEIAKHYEFMRTLPVFGEVIDGIIEAGFPLPTFQIFHIVYFPQGYLMFITYEKVPESHNIFKRFTNVFEQTYTRFLDLQKAEAQARESQIQLAMERVRARTMAMHKSEELGETAYLLFQQMLELGVNPERFVIGILSEKEDVFNFWVTEQGGNRLNTRFTGSINEPICISKWYKAVQEKKKSSVIEISGKEFASWVKYLKDELFMPLDEKLVREKRIQSSGVFSKGLLIVTSPEHLPQEQVVLLERFAAVFDQTYTRFLDLQKAEAQAREAQIEAALERVRSRSIAMHKSEELSDVIKIVSDQLQHLGFKFDNASFVLSSASEDYDFWFSIPRQSRPHHIYVPYLNNPINNRAREARSKGLKFFADIVDPLESRAWHQHMLDHNQMNFLSEAAKRIVLTSGFSRSVAIMPNIMLVIGNYASKPYSEEENVIIRRFATVFEQAYTRFLDLQKAETQAREAQIEAALEKVRSRSLAMHSTNELGEVVTVIVEKLTELDVVLDANGVVLCTYFEDSKDVLHWIVSPDFKMAGSYLLPWFDHLIFREAWESKESGDTYFSKAYSVEDKNSFFEYAFEHSDYRYFPDDFKQWVFQNDKHTLSFAWQNNSAILIPSHTGVVPTEDEAAILKRFAKVFEQAYTRFLDLQRAETQAREAQIEAALERVRSKAMSMHSSEDLAAAIRVFYLEMKGISFTPRRLGVGLVSRKNRIAEISSMNTTEQGESVEVLGKLEMTGHPVLDSVYDHWLLQKEYHPILRGNEIREYYSLIRPHIAYPDYPTDAVQFGYFFPFTEGSIYAWTEQELHEDELKIYRKFTSVLSLTYKRYKDLKDAEANALEAVRRASLDRVRAEIASMRTVDDLQRITPIIWHELTMLGVPFVRCGVFIIDESTEHIQVHLSSPDGNALGALNLPFNSSELTLNSVNHWRQGIIFKTHWDKQEFLNFMQSMIKLGQVRNQETYQGAAHPPESLHLHFVPFKQGMLYVGNTSPLEKEALELVKSLAESFSIAYARYEDFRQLEEAKNQIEKTFTELKAAQSQLIQAEKMASLGELTAGIAHEIQNPLNFVNNFSELSNELMDELKSEKAKSKSERDEVLEDEILNDIKQNLEKINHHGKRAADIVKGMLQHSRTNSGVKEPTDINALADEYLRLAYHGLRAKDKSFNAKMITDFDETIGKINVIPQDIGRVILNLITNAFYVVDEKKKLLNDGYEPVVSVSTKKIDNLISISVKDNGNGIPKHILDKIFQPFFTTKPTGQGTGLGLSLAYDIVKAHGGELKVETKEGIGSVFSVIFKIKDL